jgi:hypothetical protein
MDVLGRGFMSEAVPSTNQKMPVSRRKENAVLSIFNTQIWEEAKLHEKRGIRK